MNLFNRSASQTCLFWRALATGLSVSVFISRVCYSLDSQLCAPLGRKLLRSASPFSRPASRTYRCSRGVDYRAFCGCAHLFSVNLSGFRALRVVDDCSFLNCESLQSISLSNLPLLESIGDLAFAECVRLSSVELCDLPSLRTIGKHAFACESLQSVSAVYLPLLESIGDNAFAGLLSVNSRLRSLCEQNRAKRNTKRVD